MKRLFFLALFIFSTGSTWADCTLTSKQVLRNLFLNRDHAHLPISEMLTRKDWSQFINSLDDPMEKKWIHSNLFYDHDQIAVARDRENAGLIPLWDEGWWIFKDKPLEKFETALQEYVVSGKKVDLQKDFNIELISKFNLMLMKEKGLDGVFTEFGKVRDTTEVYFNLSINEAKKLESALNQNPLLTPDEHFVYGLKRYSYPKADQVGDLLKQSFEDFRKRMNAAKTLEERVRIYTDFSKKLVNIHPFVDGNGRTTRFTLDFLLAQEGLPVPMLSDTIDLSLSDEQFYQKVLAGIKTSNRFLEDVQWRKMEGLDIRKTPYNLVAKLPDQVWFSSKGLKGNHAPFPVDAYDYAQYVRARVQRHIDAPRDEIELLRDYVNSLKKWSVHYVKAGKENDLYQVMRVPDEMPSLMKLNRPKPRESLKKIYHDFYEDAEIHRGLSVGSTYTDEELIDHFKSMSNIHLSMSASNLANPTREKIVKRVIQNADEYNSFLEDPKQFFKHVEDHMNAEGSYSNSVFLSTSKNKAVAKRFAEGFLTNENSIRSMKGQMIISAYQPKYGAVDYNRLHEISEKLETPFYSKYPRQQEVAVVGAINPISVTRVEFKDVRVLGVKINTGETMAGDTQVLKTRILERLKDDPTKLKFTILDEHQNVISEKIIHLE